MYKWRYDTVLTGFSSPNMQANSTLLLYSSLAAAVLATILRFLFIRSFSRPYPPGPAPRPIVGNLFDMPRDYWWLTFAKWSKQYGDIVHLNILGQHIVILNSVKATRDLLDRRSAIYSDRPTLTMINDLCVSFISLFPKLCG